VVAGAVVEGAVVDAGWEVDVACELGVVLVSGTLELVGACCALSFLLPTPATTAPMPVPKIARAATPTAPAARRPRARRTWADEAMAPS
jgi:hypothetical protein